MAWFGKRKMEGRTENPCACNGDRPAAETAEAPDACSPEVKDGVCIRVLGAGCKSCRAQYENVQKAVQSMGLNAEVEYVTDMQKVTAYGVMSMPALVVNERVVSMGKVLKAAEVEALLHKLGVSY